ncbi:MAG TPA: murein biosynthesis integral membrane protein MurJ [Planctomycetota bacterium]|jgi:putative peptidoglycan lipid II flippase|nr:murein biosynthesis integral membrane protein MurJ [Planctomycetota bacterium]
MNLARRVFTVSGWTFISRILGLVRDRLWAGAMGGSLLLDCFLMAFALPNLLRNLFGEGALSAAFIPRYVQTKDKDPVAAERFAGAVVTRLAIGLTVLCALGYAVAAGMIWWGSGREVIIAAMALPQIPFLIFICIAAILSGVLNGRRHFWAAAAAPVILNLCLIATVFMNPEEEVWVLPYAVLLAGVLQVALLMWCLRTSGSVPPVVITADDEVRDLRRAIGPNLLASGAYQLNAYLDSVIAMLLVPGSGAVAILYFGNRLLQFPMALIGHGVTTAAYPEISSRAAESWQATGEGLRAACRILAFWLLPAAVGLLVTAEPLVRTIYQTGQFDESSVHRTVLVIQMLALALLPISLSKLLMRAFHARRDQRTPMRISLGMVGLNLVLNLILVQTPLREAGLALATAVSSFVGCAIYLLLLHRRGTGTLIDWRGLLRPVLGALAMAVSVLTLLWCWSQPSGHGSGMAAVRLGVAVVLGMGLYLAVAGTSWMRRPGRAE